MLIQFLKGLQTRNSEPMPMLDISIEVPIAKVEKHAYKKTLGVATTTTSSKTQLRVTFLSWKTSFEPHSTTFWVTEPKSY